MNIRQINISYDSVEDRLLLRVMAGHADEFRFWLTRAAMCGFMPQANSWVNAADTTTTSEALRHAFAREAAAANADFSVPLLPGNLFPLGEVPLLVKSLRLESEGGIAHLYLYLTDDRHIALNLEEAVLAAIQRLMREQCTVAGWNIPELAGPSSERAAATPISPLQLH